MIIISTKLHKIMSDHVNSVFKIVLSLNHHFSYAIATFAMTILTYRLL